MLIDKKSKVLIVSPHPDDEALGCGGLIGKCLKEKAKLYIYYLTVGESRQLVTGKTERKTRLTEIEAVRKLTKAKIKIGYVGEEFCRLDTVPQKELIEMIEDVIVSFKPSLTAIPSYSSYNQDHRAVYDACMTALRPVPKNIRHFVPYVLEFFEPYLWSVRPQSKPNLYLDLGESYKDKSLLDFKISLYKCHKTQARKDPFPRSANNLIRLAHIYGKEIGVETAEAYHLIRAEV